MMTKVSPEFWTNAGIEATDIEGRLAALWILTNESIQLHGFCSFSKKRFQADTDLPPEALAKGFQALGKGCVVLPEGYWLRNYIGHQVGRGPSLVKNNITRSIVRQLTTANEACGRLVLSEYPELLSLEGFVSPYGGLRASLKHKSREEKSREEQSSEGEGAGRGGVEDGRQPAGASVAERTVAVEAALTEFEIATASPDCAANFVDHYESVGWVQGRTPLKSWISALRKWARSEAKNNFGARAGSKLTAASTAGATTVYHNIDPQASGGVFGQGS